MFSFMNSGNSFQSQLESSMVRSGPRALAYADSNRYIIKKQILAAHQVRLSSLERCWAVRVAQGGQRWFGLANVQLFAIERPRILELCGHRASRW